MDINPKEVARLAKSQQGQNPNPYSGRVDNGPYHLGHLFRELPDRSKSLTEEGKLRAEAARQHAENGSTTLMHGIQAIGALMIRVGMSDGGELESNDVIAIGDLIQHLAVELRFLNEIAGYMDDVLIERLVAKEDAI